MIHDFGCLRTHAGGIHGVVEFGVKRRDLVLHHAFGFARILFNEVDGVRELFGRIV